MNQINIQQTENGFIVYELAPLNVPIPAASLEPVFSRTWSFESSEAVSEFVLDWGNGCYDDGKTGGG